MTDLATGGDDTREFPQGWGFRLSDQAAEISGRGILGGAPLRWLRLSRPGLLAVDAWRAGRLPANRSERQLAQRMVAAGVAHPLPQHGALRSAAVVIPHHNDIQGLERTLASLAATTSGLELTVVDDGSDHPTETAGVCQRRAVRLICHRINQGPGAARNTGAAGATAELLVFIDCGCEMAPGWLERLSAYFADPTIAAVAPRIATSASAGLPGLGRDRVFDYDRVHSPLDLGSSPAEVGPGRAVTYVPSTVLVVARRAWEQLAAERTRQTITGSAPSGGTDEPGSHQGTRKGAFDPDLRTGEDVDLVWRLLGAGHRVRYAPEVICTHPARSSLWSMATQRFSYGASAAPLSTRHAGHVPPAVVDFQGTPILLALLAGRWPDAIARIGRNLRSTSSMLPEDLPWEVKLRVAGRLELLSSRQLVRAGRRAWLPIWLVLSLRFRLSRRMLLASLLTTTPMGLVDDAAYCAGLWWGAWQERSLKCLTPSLRPNRRTVLGKSRGPRPGVPQTPATPSNRERQVP